LEGIAHEIYVVSGNLIARLYIEIIQYVSYFTDGVKKTKVSIQFINKKVPIRELVL